MSFTAFGAYTGTRSLSDPASHVGRSAHAPTTQHRAGLQPPADTNELLRDGDGVGGVGDLLRERIAEVRSSIEAVRQVAGGGTAPDREP